MVVPPSSSGVLTKTVLDSEMYDGKLRLPPELALLEMIPRVKVIFRPLDLVTKPQTSFFSAFY
jgi:hypothetical protein